MTVVSSLAVIALLMVVGGVWAVVTLTGAGGDYRKLPGCAVAETKTLNSLVPDHQSELNEPIEGLTESWREGRQCRWGTPTDGSRVPAAARLVLVRTDDNGGTGAEEAATNALRAASEEHSPTKVPDLGDEAYSWDEDDGGFGWGCVGVRLSNLYTLTCYTASTDYQASESIPADETVAAAEDLARDAVREIEKGDY